MTTFRHKKRGTKYKVLGEAEFQLSSSPPQEGELLTFYRSLDSGKLWARKSSEFTDGRFEIVSSEDSLSGC